MSEILAWLAQGQLEGSGPGCHIFAFGPASGPVVSSPLSRLRMAHGLMTFCTSRLGFIS